MPKIFFAGIRLPAGAGSGKVLTSDGSGNGTWQTPTTGTTLYTNTVKIDQTGGGTSTYGALVGTVNGTNAVFTVSNGSYASGSLLLFLNGQQKPLGAGVDFNETSPGSGTFTFATPPPTGSIIVAMYMIPASSTGNIVQPYGAKTANYTFNASTDNLIEFDCTAGSITVTLPDATTCKGIELGAMKIDSSGNTMTVGTTAGQTINGASTFAKSAQWGFGRFVSNGANWRTWGNN